MKDKTKKIEISYDDIDFDFMNYSSEDEHNEMISFLSEMIFIPSYEQYVINFLNNKIIKENDNKIPPLFEESNYNAEEIINEFIKSNISFSK